MGLIRKVLGLATIVAAGTVVAKSIESEKKKNDEIDAFLSPKDEDTVTYTAPVDVNKVVESLAGADENEVVFTFKVDGTDMAHTLQEVAARFHITSSYSVEENTVQLIYSGEFDDSSISELSDALNACIEESGATFVNHYFE